MKRKLLPVIIVLIGIANMAMLVSTGPQLAFRPPQSASPLVSIVEAKSGRVQMKSSTFGAVEPRSESELIPEVSGRVVSISPSMVSGGFFKQGDVLVTLESVDYEAALEQAMAGLARAESELENARRASERQRDLASKQLTSVANQDDAETRLSVAIASAREAKALLVRAKRDLVRTKIVAPYDGRIRKERVDVGQFLNRGTAIATIYATDYVEIRLPIQDDELAFIDLPLVSESAISDSKVGVSLSANFAGKKNHWRGDIVRTEGELDPQTRMITVVARVSDPYDTSADAPPLAVGLFVDAEIEGKYFDNIFVLPRTALREGGRVFIVTAEDKVAFRSVEVLREQGKAIYISSGLADGDRVIVSPMETPMEGMSVTIQNTVSEQTTGAGLVADKVAS